MPTSVAHTGGQPIQLAQTLAVATLLMLPVGAMAQAAEPASAASAPDVGKLKAVTITAERRTENLQDVPSSVTTLTGEILDVLSTSGQDLRLFSGRVPSLNIESSFGRAFPRFYIRGYGNTDFRLNASQPVSLVYDDIVQENPILKGFPAFDLDRVEVLRGPQGSLFGRNTPAGVVKFDSVQPGKAFGGYGSLSLGNLQTVNAEAAVNVPTGADGAFRISAAQPVPGRLGQEHPACCADGRARGLPRFSSACPVLVEAGCRLQRAGQSARARLRWFVARVPRQHHPARHQRTGERLQPA